MKLCSIIQHFSAKWLKIEIAFDSRIILSWNFTDCL